MVADALQDAKLSDELQQVPCFKILNQLGISITTYSKSIGNVEIDYNKLDKDNILKDTLYMPDKEASAKAQELLKRKNC